MKSKISKFRSAREAFIEELKKSKKTRELYLKVALEDYKQDNDWPAFLLALRTIIEVNQSLREFDEEKFSPVDEVFARLQKRINTNTFKI